MRVAVTSTGASLDSQIDPRFGRCQYFLFIETDDMSFEAVENPNLSLGGGAGIQSAQLVAGKGTRAVLTGNCGPNAFQTLEASGLEVILGLSGTVREAVEKYSRGELAPTETSNAPSHFGMGGGGGGGGMGGGGRGRGRGRGLGRGRGYGGGGRGVGGAGGRGRGRWT